MKEHNEPLLYSRLSTDSEEGIGRFTQFKRFDHWRKYRNLCASLLWFSGAVVMLVSAILIHTRPSASIGPDLVYCKCLESQDRCMKFKLTFDIAPAQDRVRYKQVAFPSFHSKSAYQADPSPELDELWKDLYSE
jgi:hypothetical protein